jgi:hypothetical protein
MSRRLAVMLRRLIGRDVPAARERRLAIREFVVARSAA